MNKTTSKSKWTPKLLGEIATIERDAIAPENISSGTIYVGLENITSEGQFARVTEVSNGDLASTKFRFSDKHILYGKLRPYLAKIARTDFTGVCSTDILPILPGDQVDRGFLYHFLRQPGMVDLAASRSIGANLPRLSPKRLAEFEIPLPPPSEQKRIADILNKADGIRRKRLAAVEDIANFPVSAFFELFGDPRTNPNRWEAAMLKDVVADNDKINYGVVQPGGDCPGGVPIIRVGDLQNLRISIDGLETIDPNIERQYARSRLCGDELLVACVGSIGRIALANTRLKGFNIVQAVARVRCGESINRHYLAAYLATPVIQSHFTQATRTVSQPTVKYPPPEAVALG